MNDVGGDCDRHFDRDLLKFFQRRAALRGDVFDGVLDCSQTLFSGLANGGNFLGHSAGGLRSCLLQQRLLLIFACCQQLRCVRDKACAADREVQTQVVPCGPGRDGGGVADCHLKCHP